MSVETKNKIGNFLVIAIIVITVLLAIGMVQGSNIMGYFMIAINLISSPICFILYLNEMRKGIFGKGAKNAPAEEK